MTTKKTLSGVIGTPPIYTKKYSRDNKKKNLKELINKVRMKTIRKNLTIR